MTVPRSEKINLNATTYYHVMSRCVRRSFLCGYDSASQKDYSHRKTWIVSRLKFLSSIFAIEVCAYAVMSNHFHLVLHVNDKMVKNWTHKEVVERWKLLCPQNAKLYQHLTAKVELWRERLESVSWFMKFLNEYIARAVNAEDEVRGHFWESRFKSQALLDHEAVLSAMVYVDLNPVRAGIAKTPELSDYTSIQERIKCLTTNSTSSTRDRNNQPISLKPFIVEKRRPVNAIDFELKDYLELVDITGRVFREDKFAATIPEELPSILSRLAIQPNRWFQLVKGISGQFAYAIGCEITLLNFSQRRKRAPKGRSFVASIYN